MTCMRAMVVAALALGGCASVPPSQPAGAPILASVPHERNAEGEALVIVRDFFDEVKIDGRDVPRRVQFAWNYDRGIAQERVLSPDDGTLLQTIDHTSLILRATEAELDWAIGLARADRELAARVRPNAEFYGGFAYRVPGDPNCAERSRCIHVFASSDRGAHMDFHAIVDLMTGRIVDRDADPGMGGIADHAKEEA